MADKQADRDPLAGPFHSFRVVHVIRQGGHGAGSSEISSGHLSPAAARDWISRVAKESGISQREAIHPAHGVPVTVAEQLGLDGTGAGGEDGGGWTQDELDAGRHQEPGASGEAAGDDG